MSQSSIIAVYRRPTIITFLYIVFLIPFMYLIYVFVYAQVHEIAIHPVVTYGLPLWVFIILRTIIGMLYEDPHILIHEDGLIIKFALRQKFVSWDEILEVKDIQGTHITFSKLTIFNRLLSFGGKPRISIWYPRRNHKILMKVMQTNIPDKINRVI